MTKREYPTENDYLKGEMPDGSRPPLHSRELYEGYTPPDWKPELPACVKDKTPAEMSEDELHLVIDLQLLDDLDLCRDYARFMTRIGFSAANERPASEEKGSGSGTVPDPFSAEPEKANKEEKPDVASDRQGRLLRSNPPMQTSDEQSSSHTGMAGDSHATGAGLCTNADTSANAGSSTRQSSKQAYANGYLMQEPRLDASDHEVDREATRKDHREDIKSLKDKTEREVTKLGSDSEPSETPRDSSPNDHKETSKTRQPARPLSQLPTEKKILIGERGVKILAHVSPLRAKLAHDLAKRCRALDSKEEFVEDRAVGVVKDTLFELDDAYRNLGFAAWMPFRYADQWLMFCGIMQRVLAANGLIHSEHADTYRKLLEETPPVENGFETPESLGLCNLTQGCPTLDDLRKRVEARGPP